VNPKRCYTVCMEKTGKIKLGVGIGLGLLALPLFSESRHGRPAQQHLWATRWRAPADLLPLDSWERTRGPIAPWYDYRYRTTHGPMQIQISRYAPLRTGSVVTGKWRVDAKSRFPGTRYWEYLESRSTLHRDESHPSRAFPSAAAAYAALKAHWGIFSTWAGARLRKEVPGLLPPLSKWRRARAGDLYTLKLRPGWIFRLRPFEGGWVGDFKGPGQPKDMFEGGTWAYGATPEEAAEALRAQIEAYKQHRVVARYLTSI
jgi:hypothetical protein